MKRPFAISEQWFRVWVAGCAGWVPKRWDDVPPAAVALVPMEDEHLPADAARALVQGYNEEILADPKPLWAVALPVSLRYEGDAQAGQKVVGYQFHQEPPLARDAWDG